jgi:hypothetical protein
MCHAVGDNGEKGRCHAESSRVSKRGDPSAFEKRRGHQRGRHHPPSTSPLSIWHSDSCWFPVHTTTAWICAKTLQLDVFSVTICYSHAGSFATWADTDCRRLLLQILHSRHQIRNMIVVVVCVARGITRYESTSSTADSTRLDVLLQHACAGRHAARI